MLPTIGGICSTTGTGVYIGLAGIPEGGQVTEPAVAIVRLVVAVWLFVTSDGFVPLFASEILNSCEYSRVSSVWFQFRIPHGPHAQFMIV